MTVTRVLLKRLDTDLAPPARENPGDAGWDLRSRQDVDLLPGQRAVIPTGVAIALPAGFVALVHPRSGLAARSGFTLLNAPGTIDAGYRGEISVIGINTDSTEPLAIKRGERIAQLVIQRVSEIEFMEVEQLPDSVRSSAGFGSTGSH